MSEDREFSARTEELETEFRAALNKIAHDTRYQDLAFQDVVSFIARTAGEVLDCQRASVWEYNESPSGEKSIRCLTQWDKDQGLSEEETVLGEADAATYLNALDVDSLLIMNDVATDPRCAELNQAYIPAHGITSMLDAPFEFNGKLAGVLCLEHVGPGREWQSSEQHFSTNMANLLTIAAERDHRRRSEAALQEEEHRFRLLVENLALGFAVVVNERIAYANNTAAEILKVDSPAILVGMRLTELFPNAEAWELRQWETSVKVQPQGPTEYRFRLWEGTKATLEVTSSSVNWYGEPALQAVFRDVTEASDAQWRLRRSEEQLSEAQKIARLGSWIWDLRTDETDCSEELRELLGLTDNPLRQPIVSMAHPEDAARLKAAQVHAIRSHDSYQITYRVNTDSGLLWLEETGVPEAADGEVVRIRGTSRDITRQKFAELEAQATEERFSALANSFPGGFIYCDLSARFLFINKTYASWFDIDHRDYLGKPIASLIGENAYHDFEPHVESVTRGQSVTFEQAPTFMHEGVGTIQYTLAPDMSVNGEMRGFFGLMMDITELRSVELALRQAQKMEAMGQLTGGIAHDFNNILAILMGNLELARQVSDDEDTTEYIDAALQGVEKGVALTQKLLGFARSKTTTGNEPVSLNQLIVDMYDMIAQSVGARVRLSIENCESPWLTRVNQGDFEDALLNLCINARDAMPDGGELLVSTLNKTVDESLQRIHPSLQPGDYVVVSVSDSGIGMDEATRDRMFEPFYTTKPEGKGTGLGMSMVFGFVKRSGGQVIVYSAEGAGTTINIYFPRHETGHADFAREVVTESRDIRSQGSVLIVDDEPMVADVAAGILAELGYSTMVATNSADALAMVQEQPVDLLFSDVVMPDDLNGFELARKAMAARPDIKVLLTSGFSKFRGIEPGNSLERQLAADILGKPYNRQELAHSVRSILNG